MYLFGDEGGDLGFDFCLQNTSHYLTMTYLICGNLQAAQTVKRAVRLTAKNKLGAGATELKGTNTTLALKLYFYKHLLRDADWWIATAILDKAKYLRWCKRSIISADDKNFLYDEVTRCLLAKVDFGNAHSINLSVDKSKTPYAMEQFHLAVSSAIRESAPQKALLAIQHRHSHCDPGLQAVDLFNWGIFRKYQQQDVEWYKVFKDRIRMEVML